MSLSKSLVREVSRQCADELRSHVAARAASMPAAELRGYILAHARGTVRAHAIARLGNNDAPARVDELIDAALAYTVHLVTSAFQLPRIVALSPPHVGEVAEPISLPLRAAGAIPQRKRKAA